MANKQLSNLAIFGCLMTIGFELSKLSTAQNSMQRLHVIYCQTCLLRLLPSGPRSFACQRHQPPLAPDL